jgi:hypothetical protein
MRRRLIRIQVVHDCIADYYGAKGFHQFVEHAVRIVETLRPNCLRVCADAHKSAGSCIAAVPLAAPFGILAMLGTAQAPTNIDSRLAHSLKGRWPLNMTLSLAPIVALIAGILILIAPRLLNYIVALYLIVTGLIGLFGNHTFHFH